MGTINMIVLSISGLLLSFVGASRLSNPIKSYAKNSGIKLENEVNLLNELRGVSALMLSGGIIILLGIILPTLTNFSFVVACLIFLGFALGRLLAIAIDGKPNKQIVGGLFSELVLGAANIFCLLNV